VAVIAKDKCPHHSSWFVGFRPCIAACRCLKASARPPAILPLLSLAPGSTLLAPLPEYPLSRAAEAGAGFFAAGRFAGGAGGAGLPRRPPFAGRAGGAGGAGGGAGLLITSSRYAEGAHPEADLSSLLANHQPGIMLAMSYMNILSEYTYRCSLSA
jgi:hypothetical protein